MSDSVIGLHFKTDCRAVCTRLTESWQQMSASLDLPAPVLRMLGELVAAGVMLAGDIKYRGTLSLQILGDGPVRMAVVEISDNNRLRATAKMREGAIVTDNACFPDMVNVSGRGQFTVVADFSDRSADDNAFRSLVPLNGKTVAETMEHYLTQSEQIETCMRLACDEKCCAGLMVQRVPVRGGKQTEKSLEHETADHNAENFNTVEVLAQTVKSEELLGLDPHETVHRLFREVDHTVFDYTAPVFSCRCSREKVLDVIKRLGEAEARSVIAERGMIEVRCEFCGSLYVVDGKDVDRLFAGKEMPQESLTSGQTGSA